MVHEIKVQPKYYDKIAAGTKIYEVRLFDEKRKLFAVGDTLVIKREPNLDKKLEMKISGLLRFDSFLEMARSLPLENVGFENCSVEEGCALYHKFYSAEDEKKYGVVAIKLERMEK